METTTKKGIPYKAAENKATTNILVRLTETQKRIIQANATANNQTVSEYFRTTAIKQANAKGK